MKPILALVCLAASACGVWSQTTAPGSIVPIDADGHILSYFSDPVSYRKGEPITVVVNLSSTATATKNLSTAKSASIDSGSVASPLIPSELIKNYGLTLNGANSTASGTGSLGDTESLTTTFTGIITDVLPHDIFRIEAHRTYIVGKEKNEIILTGIVRRSDISSTNEINSTQIADVQLEQKGSGPLSRTRDKGWLTTIYEFLSPF